LPKRAYDTRLNWKIQYLGIGHPAIKRLRNARAGRPEKARVSSVLSPSLLRSWDRGSGVAVASGQPRKAVPNCAPLAPSAKAAASTR